MALPVERVSSLSGPQFLSRSYQSIYLRLISLCSLALIYLWARGILHQFKHKHTDCRASKRDSADR